MRWFLLACSLALLACGSENPESAPEADPDRAAWRAALLAAAPAESGVLLTDDTPRIDAADEPGPDTWTLYLRGASVRVPREGLSGVAVASGDEGLEVRLAYGERGATIVDRTGTPALAAEFAALRAVGTDLGSRTLEGIEAPGLDRSRKRWDRRFERRFAESYFHLVRAALRARVDPGAEELSDLYRDVRLALVKERLVEQLGGEGVRPLAAGPTLGLRRDAAKEVDAAVHGPDGMAVRVRLRGTWPPAAAGRLLGGYRPCVESDSAAARLDRAAAAEKGPVRALLALSALHAKPDPERVVRLVAALPELAPDEKKRLRAALDKWLRTHGSR